MTIGTINATTNHAQHLVNDLRGRNELPFTDVLSPSDFSQYFSEIPHRNRTFTPDLTLFGFLSQAIGADKSCQAAVSQITTHIICNGNEPPSANTAAYCKARARLPESVLSGLTKNSGQQLENQAKPKWLWRNKHVKLVDGATLSMPDTRENQKIYPQPNTQKKGLVFQ